jgi:4-amino-4-deoxy-L-arabinose transferase-like glycosyltransferase
MTSGTEEASVGVVDAPGEPKSMGSLAWQPLVLTGIVLAACAVNLWWIAAHRSGLPFDIDEAGYLQRAVRDADALHAGGLSSLWSTVRGPDPQAPLLPVVAGTFRWITGAGTYRMFAVLQAFYVVTVVSAYFIARRLSNRNWSLVAAVMVAAIPAVVVTSRTFDFALPAAAMLTMTLAVQLYTNVFRRQWLSILWGICLGLTVLSRTLMVALVPALLIAGVVTVASSRPTRRQLVNLTAGLVVALLVAGSWYSATWRPVLRYLTTYGYGAQASSYGTGNPVLSFSFWTSRINTAANELYAPITLALVACFAAGLLGWAVSRSRRAQLQQASSPAAVVARLVRRPEATVWAVVLGGYLALSSSPNTGTFFELPLLPAVCVLAASIAGRVPHPVRGALAAACVAASALSFAGSAGAVPGVASSEVSVAIGPVQLTALDGRSNLVAYASGTGVVCDSANRCAGEDARNVASYLRRWTTPVQEAASFMRVYAATQSCSPFVFFAVQDPFFNTNTVDLEYQVAYASSLPTGLLVPPPQAGESFDRQLTDPTRGQPDFVITGPVPPYNRAFSPLLSDRAAVLALRKQGFQSVDSVRLPDGRRMTFWWKHPTSC